VCKGLDVFAQFDERAEHMMRDFAFTISLTLCV
jgi:hypothetical protein